MNRKLAAEIVRLSLPQYGSLRAEYWRQVYQSVQGYLADDGKDDDWFRNAMRVAVEAAFLRAAILAWEDGGGGSTLSVSALAFLAAYKLAEFDFVESLLLALRVKKYPPKEEAPELEEIEIVELARRRADGYSQGLDMLYNNLKVRGAGDKLLTFVGDDGMESCSDCRRYKGKTHPASWWARHDAIPPNRKFECKGYHCFHILVDKAKNVYTI